VVSVAFAFTGLAVLATLLGWWLAARRGAWSPSSLAGSLAFAAGVMIAISVGSLIPTALVTADLPSTLVAVTVGAAIILGAHAIPMGGPNHNHPNHNHPNHNHPNHNHPNHEHVVDGHKAAMLIKPSALRRTSVLTALAIGLHNIPEGAAPFAMTRESLASGALIAAVIALHNIPEGFAISAPLLAAGGSGVRALALTSAAAAAEVVGALLVFAMPPSDPTHVALVLAGVAGMMLALSAVELLPTAWQASNAKRPPVMGLGAGIAAMTLVIALTAL
jgi:zinc transporter, ZIP family